jgi:Leucine-rich repeat (LRR) protein
MDANVFMNQWKRTYLVLFLMFALFAGAVGTANAEEAVVQEKILYNGMMIEGSTMIPLREAFEFLGAEIEWEPDTMTVTASKGEQSIILQIGSREAEINGVKEEISAAPVLYEGVTRIPVRVASTALGATVEWDEDNRIATVLQEDRKLVIRVSAALEGDTVYVYFADPAVEKYIRDSLYLPSGSLSSGPNPYYGYTGPVQQKHLDVFLGFHHTRRMKDLSGLQYAKNIDSLSFEEGTIEDISFLQEFKSLVHLSLPSDVKGIETLHKLDGLVALTFNGPFRQMDELGEALAGMKSLEVLNIYNLKTEHVDGLAALAGNPSFKWLNISSDSLKDISGLSQLVHLERLQLEGHHIDDLSALSSMTELEQLDLRNNRISELEPLQGLTKLTSLQLSNNQIENVEPLSYLTRLENLALEQNQIRSVEPLGQLTALQSLSLSNNRVTDEGVLASIPSLSSLYLDYNELSDLASLSELKRIEQLSLAGNQISDLQPLAKLKTLEMLNVSQNLIQDITPLGEITSLRSLDLSQNELSDIETIATMNHLEDINLNETQVQDAHALLQAPKLFQISLQSTLVDDETLLQELQEKTRNSAYGYFYH